MTSYHIIERRLLTTTKTVLCAINHKDEEPTGLPPYVMSGVTLTKVNQQTYLGIELTSGLS